MVDKQDEKDKANKDDSSNKDVASNRKDQTSADQVTLSKKELSDMLSKAGYEAVQKAKAEHKKETDELRQQISDIELASVGDDQDKRTALQKKQDQAKREKEYKDRIAELEEENQGLKTKVDEAEKSTKEQTTTDNASKILKKYKGITKEQLLKRTDGTEEDMEAYAKDHGELVNPEEAEEIPDTNETKGGGESDAWKKEWYPTMAK